MVDQGVPDPTTIGRFRAQLDLILSVSVAQMEDVLLIFTSVALALLGHVERGQVFVTLL